jgi:hypothetical protein
VVIKAKPNVGEALDKIVGELSVSRHACLNHKHAG